MVNVNNLQSNFTYFLYLSHFTFVAGGIRVFWSREAWLWTKRLKRQTDIWEMLLQLRLFPVQSGHKFKVNAKSLTTWGILQLASHACYPCVWNHQMNHSYGQLDRFLGDRCRRSMLPILAERKFDTELSFGRSRWRTASLDTEFKFWSSAVSQKQMYRDGHNEY
jgi:hypothetical protein